ncbi:MAG: FAD-dependent oxidoreductase [Bifidobacteriaceae bacterium]|jgi:fumarate reductase flavoprotein subunit|nr:FAD-dependent oxidoreductase [Bifidobacteriaceae bacterium]
MSGFDIEYDVVVIGGGGAGKSAAYTAAKEGGLRVALLEKEAETGGSSVHAEGTGAFESSEQKARGKPDDAWAHYPTRQEGFQRYMDYSSKRCNPEVVRMQVNNTAETIDIYKSLGITYTYVGIYAYDQPAELYTFHRPEGLGARCQEVLLKACIDAGVEIFTSTPATSLIKDGDRVVGVVARDADGQEVRVGAKAVIIASGGFGGNPEMVLRYSRFPNALDLGYNGPPGNTGDGANMAIAAGADTWEMGTMMFQLAASGKTFSAHISGAAVQPVLWINKKSRRFWDEHVAMSFADSANVVAAQPGAKVYAIFDSATVDHLIEDGSDVGLGDWIVFHQKLTNLRMELEEAAVEGEMCWKADTIEELAAKCGLDPAKVAAEVARYNGFCAAGDDADFFKDPRFLRPVTMAPYYAIELHSTILVSCGALKVNGDMQVIDTSDQVIPGLYAAGLDAGGLYGDAYNLDVPGTANGFAHASGRVAARHAIATING